MRAALLVMSFLFLLLSHLPAFNSLSYFRANLFSCDTRYTELCPCDVTFHQMHLLLGHVILLQNTVFGPAWTGPSVSSWFPPISRNGISTWRILCVMNGFHEQASPQFYLESTWGALHLCHPGGTVGKPWVAPRVSACSCSHPLEMSEKCPGENVLAQLTDRWTHSKTAPYSVNLARVHSGNTTGSWSGGHSKPHGTRDSDHFIRSPPFI